MRVPFRPVVLALALVIPAAGTAACGDGEDRPGQVTSEGGGTGSGSASGTGSGSASGSGTHAGEHEGGQSAEFTEDEADTAVTVTATDFAFNGIPLTLRGPKVFFTVRNEGQIEHEFDVEGQGHIEPFEGGEERTLALELEPGDYTVVCLVEEGDQTHADLGMRARFTVLPTG